LKQKDYVNCLNHVEKCNSLVPGCPVTLSRLAFCLLQLGDIEKAESYLNEAKKSNVGNSSDFPLINFLDSKVARTKGN